MVLYTEFKEKLREQVYCFAEENAGFLPVEALIKRALVGLIDELPELVAEAKQEAPDYEAETKAHFRASGEWRGI